MDLIPSNIVDCTLEYYLGKINSRSRIIYWVIILSVILAMSLLPFIYVDVSVLAPGYFQSEIEKLDITVPFQGRIINTTLYNGRKVDKGDTILQMDSEFVEAKFFSLQQRISENDSCIADLKVLTSLDSITVPRWEFKLQTKKYKAEYGNFLIQYLIQLQKYRKRKTEHERNSKLHKQALIADTEFENSLFQVSSDRESLQQVLVSQKAEWLGDLYNRNEEAVKLIADLEYCREELSGRFILSPVSGEILQVAGLQCGSIVNGGQKVAEITPDGELIATCFIKPSDIGLIDSTKLVRIQVDAFTYHEWGMLTGKILDISDDLITGASSSVYFRVRCKPERDWLMLRNGTKAGIKKGMSFTARIVLIRRSLFNLIFDRTDKWFNPYTHKKVEP
jgi:HlyD family secretion protein